jgi:hypothetical protein
MIAVIFSNPINVSGVMYPLVLVFAQQKGRSMTGLLAQNQQLS